MRQKPGTRTSHGEKVIKDIRRATSKHYSSDEKIRIVLDGLKGEDSIAELCHRDGIAQSLYYSWSKEFLEAGNKRLAGDTARYFWLTPILRANRLMNASTSLPTARTSKSVSRQCSKSCCTSSSMCSASADGA